MHGCSKAPPRATYPMFDSEDTSTVNSFNCALALGSLVIIRIRIQANYMYVRNSEANLVVIALYGLSILLQCVGFVPQKGYMYFIGLRPWKYIQPSRGTNPTHCKDRETTNCIHCTCTCVTDVTPTHLVGSVLGDNCFLTISYIP